MNLHLLTALFQTRALPENAGSEARTDVRFSEFFQVTTGEFSEMDVEISDQISPVVAESEIEVSFDSEEAEFEEILLEAGMLEKRMGLVEDVPSQEDLPDAQTPPDHHESQDLILQNGAGQEGRVLPDVSDLVETLEAEEGHQEALAEVPLSGVDATGSDAVQQPSAPISAAQFLAQPEPTGVSTVVEPQAPPLSVRASDVLRAQSNSETEVANSGADGPAVGLRKFIPEAGLEKTTSPPERTNPRTSERVANTHPVTGTSPEALGSGTINAPKATVESSECSGAVDQKALSPEHAEQVIRTSMTEALMTEVSSAQSPTLIRTEVRVADPVLMRVPEAAAEQKLFISEVADHLGARVVQHPEGVVELELEPADLGRLKMTFQKEDGMTTVVVEVDKRETLDLMRRHAEQFVADLKSDTQGDVRLKFEMSGQAQNQGRGQGQPYARPHENAASLDENQQDPAPSRRILSSGSRTDIRV
ncbi:MAG: flagellar hook-length control protein FliK [Pseudomonadota bacterium]|nr:flagellar hook-length control protein FliK [Pseudomonadota bacterium]